MLPQTTLYPLLIERKLVYRLWGGQRVVEWLHLTPPYPPTLGETWEVFDSNPVRNGVLAGQTLAQVSRFFRERLIGTRLYGRYGAEFPLLVKFIDANDKLSLQVHPDDTYVQAHETQTDFHGKTEAWYILRARPNANIVHGFSQIVSRETFLAAVQHERLEPYLQHVPVQRGDVIFTPPGTLHAINNGILLYEIQQKSDLTYRVYDYGRRDPATGEQRALHLEKAMDVLRLAPSGRTRAVPVPLDAARSRLLLLACRHFALELWSFAQTCEHTVNPASMDILTVIEGEAEIAWRSDNGGNGGHMDVRTGDSVVLPATLGAVSLTATSTLCRLLRVFVPDIEQDIVAPLRARGASDERIAEVVFAV